MISVIHLRPPAEHASFAADAEAVLAVFSARPGFRTGSLSRATDDDTAWVLLTEWESVGAYRRGLGAYDVKLIATPLMAFAEDRPSAFEALLSIGPDGQRREAASDRAIDADWIARVGGGSRPDGGSSRSD